MSDTVQISLNFRFTVVPPKSRFANVLYASVLSRFAYVLGLFPVLISSNQWQKERGICMRISLSCIMAEGTKYIHSQRSFRFLSGTT